MIAKTTQASQSTQTPQANSIKDQSSEPDSCRQPKKHPWTTLRRTRRRPRNAETRRRRPIANPRGTHASHRTELAYLSILPRTRRPDAL